MHATYRPIMMSSLLMIRGHRRNPVFPRWLGDTLWLRILIALLGLGFPSLAVPSRTEGGEPAREDAEQESIPQLPVKDFTRHYRYPVAQVLNGNTITIRVKHPPPVLMELLGVHAPHPESVKFLKELLEGEEVFLEYGPVLRSPSRDGWMAYLYRARDDLFINGEIISKGYGLAVDHQGPRRELLAHYHRVGRRDGIGLWAGDQLQNYHTVRSPEYVAGIDVVRSRRKQYLEGLGNYQMLQSDPELAVAMRHTPSAESRVSIKTPTSSIDKAFASTRKDGTSDRIIQGGLGSIVRNSQLRGKPSVVVFEETHTSRLAQVQIALMLHRLYRDHGMRHICLEGYVKGTEANASWFRKLPVEPSRKRRIVTRMLEEGEISSAEYMALLFPNVVLHPIEDAAQYKVDLDIEADGAIDRYVTQILGPMLSQDQSQEVNRLQRAGENAKVADYLRSVNPWFKEISKLLHPQGGRTQQSEEFVALIDELGRQANAVGYHPSEKDKRSLLALRKFFETASERSRTMAAATRDVERQFREKPLSMIIGAAHTWMVGQLLDRDRLTYGVIRPAAMDVKERADDLSLEAFHRKGQSLSADEMGLGSLLDQRNKPLDRRKKPPPVISEAWFQAKAELYILADTIAQVTATHGAPGARLPQREAFGELELGSVHADAATIQRDGEFIAFRANVFADDPRKPTTVGVWTRPNGRAPQDLESEDAEGHAVERLLMTALEGFRDGASPPQGPNTPAGLADPADPRIPKSSRGGTTPFTLVSSETAAKFSLANAPAPMAGNGSPVDQGETRMRAAVMEAAASESFGVYQDSRRVDPAILTLQRHGENALVLVKRPGGIELMTVNGRVITGSIKGPEAIDRLDADSRSLVREKSNGTIQFVHASSYNSQDRATGIHFQIGNDAVTLTQAEFADLRDGVDTQLSIDRLFSRGPTRSKFIIYRDAFSRGAYESYDHRRAHVKPLELAKALERRYGIDHDFFLDDEMDRGRSHAEGLGAVKRPDDLVLVSDKESFPVWDFGVVANIETQLTQSGIKVIKTISGRVPADIQSLEASNLIVLTGHKDQAFRDQISQLGSRGLARGKVLALFSCYQDGDESFNSRMLREATGATAVLFYTEKIKPQAVEDVLHELSLLIGDMPASGLDLKKLLNLSVDRALKNAHPLLRNEVQKMRSGVIQVSLRDARDDSPPPVRLFQSLG